jgi:hypothetical protein
MNQIHIQYVEKKDIRPASVYSFPICKPDENHLVFFEEIPPNHAWNARCFDCCLCTTDHSWLQWPLA